MSDEKPVVGKTKHGELTLDQIANLQPGWGGLMPQISERWWICHHAAKAGNWKLASYALRKVQGLFKTGAVTRPKYTSMVQNYDKEFLQPVAQAVAAGDFAAFDAAFKRATDEGNRLHIAVGHGEIIWTLPEEPPKHLKMNP
ncbi:MAG: hypothetical protein WC429_02000 [Verrucomicrobiia bacterium]|jgi:hypothetical protein